PTLPRGGGREKTKQRRFFLPPPLARRALSSLPPPLRGRAGVGGTNSQRRRASSASISPRLPASPTLSQPAPTTGRPAKRSLRSWSCSIAFSSPTRTPTHEPHPAAQAEQAHARGARRGGREAGPRRHRQGPARALLWHQPRSLLRGDRAPLRPAR